MRALSIRQPYAEMILRGEKTIEYRSRPTKLIGEQFYIYAAKKWAGVQVPRSEVRPQKSEETGPMTSDLCPLTSPPESFPEFPTGVIVGTATITHCELAPPNGHQPTYCWHLSDVQRIKTPRRPTRQPQPVWFKPF
jgi:hypothetical protein